MEEKNFKMALKMKEKWEAKKLGQKNNKELH